MTSGSRAVSRRVVLSGAAGLTAAHALSSHGLFGGEAAAAQPIFIADMHYHLFFVGKRPAETQFLAAEMASSQTALVAWSMVGDQPWLAATAKGFQQSGAPKSGQGGTWLNAELDRVERYLAREKLPLVRTPADLARAVAGQPHVLLAVEGATFVDDGIAELEAAARRGVRHVQLVHFIENRIGDMQTVAARHGGLTAYGREVVQACNRLGILIDLAHCSDQTVHDVLALSKVPVVWSHSSARWVPLLMPSLAAAWKLRQLSRSTAEAIAKKGGVIGLWALSADIGRGIEAYADRVMELADQLGENHVAFGTDTNALAQPAIQGLTDLRRVVALLAARGVSESRVRKIAMGNYVGALKAAMDGRKA